MKTIKVFNFLKTFIFNGVGDTGLQIQKSRPLLQIENMVRYTNRFFYSLKFLRSKLQGFSRIKKSVSLDTDFLLDVGDTGFEPVTPCL
jgi:hypothetical protein